MYSNKYITHAKDRANATSFEDKVRNMATELINNVKHDDAAQLVYTKAVIAKIKESMHILGYDVGELFLLGYYDLQHKYGLECRAFIRYQNLIDDICKDKSDKYGLSQIVDVAALTILMTSDASTALGRKATWGAEDDYKEMRHMLLAKVADVFGFDWTHLVTLGVSWDIVNEF